MDGNLFQLYFRLVYEDKSVYAEYNVKDFEELLLAEWEKIQNAGDRKEVIKRAFERACESFKYNAVAFKD